jgi:hypothetical protein
MGGNEGKILYCEDDEVTRMLITKTIARNFFDFSIIPTDNIEDAIKAAREHLEGLRVILTDGEIIKERQLRYGWELAQAARNMNYDGAIVYVGGTFLPQIHEGLFTHVIEKSNGTYRDDIINCLREITDQ